MPTQEQITSYLDQLQAIVRDAGWAIQGVFPTEDDSADDVSWPFAYTVGLAAKGYPELLMIGDSFEWQGAVLNHLAAIATNGEHQFSHGELARDDLWKGDLRIRGPVDDVAGGCPVHMARNYYAFTGQADPEAVTVLQVEWPDPDGVYADAGGAEYKCSPQLPLAKPIP